MSGPSRRPRRPDHWSSAHERARSRAAERLDTPLDPTEAAWLEEHLAGCAECRTVAAAYVADRTALRALRDIPIDPPRDLWARTAAGIERESARRGGARGRRQTAPSTGFRFPFGAFSGVLVVILVVGAAAMSGGWLDQPQSPPDGTPGIAETTLGPETSGLEAAATPITVAVGDVTWVHSLPDGDYAVNTSSVEQVCTGEDQPGCASLDEHAPERISLDSKPRTIIGSPTDDQAVVVGSDGAGSDKVFVMALPEAPERTAEPTKSPPPTSVPASPQPKTAVPTETATGPTEAPESPDASPSDTPETAEPTETADATPSETPESTPSEAPTERPATPAPTPTVSASPQATASAMAIASGVTVVGQSAAFSDDGRWFAFTARPSDGSAGPDIWVWHMGDKAARKVTDDGRSVFASWAGDRVVGSRIDPETTAAGDHVGSSFLLDPDSGKEVESHVALWRPVVDPKERFAVAWDGTVVTNEAGTILAPGSGQLVVTSWRPDGAAVATRSRVPGGDARIADLDVRWNESGDWVAIWTADPSDPSIGRLSLYRLDAGSGELVRAKGAPRDVPALPGFSIGDGRLAWVTPHGQDAEGSKVQVVAWSGDGVGQVESVPADDVLVVR